LAFKVYVTGKNNITMKKAGNNQMKVAVLGLGLMGSAVAEGMLNVGHEVIVYNRTMAKTKGLVEKGAVAVQTAAEAIRMADAAISTAEQLSMSTRLLEDMRELFVKATDAGYGAKDASSVVEILLEDN
jgi:3-hydroxyisobutyrate dehydrogenase-like beta-hydroxyacid dehydrogenase